MILQQIGFTTSALQMMKWAFLLSQETPSRGGKTFYHFIPYKYGPYSFTLQQERDALIRNGYLEGSDDRYWTLTNIGRSLEINLPVNVAEDIQYIMSEYGRFSSQKLIELVYNQYSWFTANSVMAGKRRRNRPVAESAIHTAGYEGRTVDEFLNLLMESGIARLIDVRFNPVSRRYGFHKSTLSRLCGYLDIDYQHLPELGIPGSERGSLAVAGGHQALFVGYQQGLESKGAALSRVVDLLRGQPSVLVCMEADPQFCHRNVLAKYLASSINLPVKHLGVL
jgi:uncharacterized protein (DUF488 family)